MSKLIKPSAERDDKIALVPHYVDHYRVREVYGKSDGFRIVNMLDPVEKVVEDITRSAAVVTSALHGMVVADAYHLPCAWARFTPNVCGDGTKYVDHMAAVGRIQIGEWAEPIDVREKNIPETFNWWKDKVKTSRHIDSLIDQLWACCPLREVK